MINRKKERLNAINKSIDDINNKTNEINIEYSLSMNSRMTAKAEFIDLLKPLAFRSENLRCEREKYIERCFKDKKQYLEYLKDIKDTNSKKTNLALKKIRIKMQCMSRHLLPWSKEVDSIRVIRKNLLEKIKKLDTKHEEMRDEIVEYNYDLEKLNKKKRVLEQDIHIYTQMRG